MPISESDVDFFQPGTVLSIGGSSTSLNLLNLGILGGTYAGNSLGTVTTTSLTRAEDTGSQLNVGESFTLSRTVDPVIGQTTTTNFELTMAGTGTISGLLGTRQFIIGQASNGQQYVIFPNGDQPTGLELVGDTVLATITTAEVGYDFDANAPLCFTRGTMIRTPDGDRAVEDLKAGDLVVTKDHGPQPIRWIGSRSIAPATLKRQQNLRPIMIRAGALGMNTPGSDLIVSPQHRVLLRSDLARSMFGAAEVLVAAKQLLQIDGVEVCNELDAGVEYFHILFDQHEVVFSNGAETESLYTGPQALKTVGPRALEEIFSIFPELQAADYEAKGVRLLPSGREGRQLVARHLQDRHPLVSCN